MGARCDLRVSTVQIVKTTKAWGRRAALGLAMCAALATPAAALSPADHPELDTLIDALAAQHGFERKQLRRWFADAQLRPEIIAAMERPNEGLPWHSYRAIFLNDERARLGKRYWDEHERLLARAERQYGVPAEIIVAIIGVETRYGTNKGDYPALDALLTITLGYPRRAAFFRRELEELLLLARELKLDPRKIKGSYAGALGIPQFIPSSYRQYAVDFDGNRRRELVTSHADAIGSVANFLARHGWVAGQPVIDPAQVDGPLNVWLEQLGARPMLPLRQWVGHGISPQRETAHADDEWLAALVVLEGEAGPLYHLGYNNFYVITRYNHSKNYAMAVHELGRMIRSLRERDK